MGFDVLYLPPIHPIGLTNRKGRNNSLTVAPGDPGSPWAIGSADGGHKAVHPELGTLDDFEALVAGARSGRDWRLPLISPSSALRITPMSANIRNGSAIIPTGP